MLSSLRRPLLALGFAAVALALPPATASTGNHELVAARFDRVVHVREGATAADSRTYVSLRRKAATLAVRMVGTPYRWGGESPESGFDCSGLIRWAYGQLGVDVPHSSYVLYSDAPAVSWKDLQTGDVLVFTGIGHVGLYLGGGRMVHAPYSGKSVELVDLAGSSYGSRLVGIRRIDLSSSVATS